jgi:tetratricopeptide (TPR) repeat protein
VFGEALTHFKLKNFRRAKKCVELAIKTYEKESFESINILRFMKAMCDKNLGNYEDATHEYHRLKKLFGRDEGGKVMGHIAQSILMPL